MVYFARDMTTEEYIMPYTVTVETISQLTSEINTKISTLTITGSLVNVLVRFHVISLVFRIFNSSEILKE